METFEMEKSVILDNNIKIAEFLGWQYKSEEENWDKSRIKGDSWEDIKGLGHISLSFDTSWEWIMPVVDKIEKMGYNFSTRFNHDAKPACHFTFFAERDESGEYPHKPYGKKLVFANDKKNGVYSSETSKLESIYLAVLGFIKYHNEKES